MFKVVYVIAGPNGAGKTTFAKEFLPHYAHCDEFVNADMIATGISPFSPRRAALEAGRLMLSRIRELMAAGQTFGFETTLAGKSYASLFRRLHQRGYRIDLIYLWLPTPELAIKRVQDRVRQGGHNIPEVDIRRRFTRGLQNLFRLYRPLMDSWTLLDNSGQTPKTIATGTASELSIAIPDVFGYIEAKFSL
jgi:predicted ABC-type ATPase